MVSPPMPSTAVKTPRRPVGEGCLGLIAHLVLRCGRGDEGALGELFDSTFPFVAAAVRRGGAPSTALDDAIVEAYWRLWDRSPAYEPSATGVLAWVMDQVLDGAGGLPGAARGPLLTVS